MQFLKFTTRITDAAQKAIKENLQLRISLMGRFNRSEKTIILWADTKDDMLTTPDALAIIAHFTSEPPEDLIEKKKLQTITA